MVRCGLLLPLAIAACNPAMPRAQAPVAPQEQSKCSVMASSLNPLVTEWPASEKANLEARLRGGGVAVAYSGCEMQLLTDCRVGGAYAWQRTSTSRDRIEISNEDELYAKLPLGAVALEGELRSSGRLAMQTTVTGQLRLDGMDVRGVSRAGACRDATHVVSALSVGAFELRSGGRLTAGVSVGVGAAGSGVSTASREVLLREAGDPTMCDDSTDETPHAQCSSPLQVFLTPLPWTVTETVPPGTVRVAFSAANPESKWEVVAGGQAVCQTPCEQIVSADAPVLLRDGEPKFLSPSDEIEIPPLRAHTGRAVEVRAQDFSFGLFAGGLSVTTIGGLGTIMGAIFTPIGCGRDDADAMGSQRDGMCEAGVGMLVGGAVVAGLGGVMMIFSAPKAEVLPFGRMQSTEDAHLWLAPGAVGGRF